MSLLEPMSFLRFLLVGVANTALTGALLLVLATQLDLALAYTIVYVSGVAFSTTLTASFVFRSQLSIGKATRFVVWYVCVYLLGVSVIELGAGLWHASHILTFVTVLAITVPLNFLGGNLVFRSRPTSNHS